MKTVTPRFLILPILLALGSAGPLATTAAAATWSEEEAARAAQDISEARYASRADVVASAERLIRHGAKWHEALGRTLNSLGQDERKDMLVALNVVEKARAELSAAITAGRGAPEATWDAARDDLAESYAGFDTALRAAQEVAARAGVRVVIER